MYYSLSCPVSGTVFCCVHCCAGPRDPPSSPTGYSSVLVTSSLRYPLFCSRFYAVHNWQGPPLPPHPTSTCPDCTQGQLPTPPFLMRKEYYFAPTSRGTSHSNTT